MIDPDRTERAQSITWRPRSRAVTGARRDMIAGAITFAAIFLFVVNGGAALGGLVRWMSGMGPAADRMLAGAVLLNVALLLFGWRRYRDLRIEVVERTAAERRAQTLASHDPLTGFLNRRALFEQAGTLAQDAAATGRAIGALVIDLDGFKKINDVHGHMAGDDLLRHAAGSIRQSLPPGVLAARLGGDEFACVCSLAADDHATLDKTAAKIVQALARPILLGEIEMRVCASVGSASTSDAPVDAELLIRRADIAMYVAKHRGGSRVCAFDPSMEAALAARSAIEADMRAGLERGEFVPYYEQQIELESGALIGFEVLARWLHPRDGIVSPEIFIPIAEANGLIGELSGQVIRQALEDARDWDPGLTLSVNISATQLHDPWLAQKLLKLLLETGFPPERLEIEVTEAALFQNLTLARATVASLKNQGVKLALDDFGTGQSSLVNLRALPFDRIKIDRSFVTALIGDSNSDMMVNAIAQLGETLGLPVIAEGIEDAAIAERLRAIGLLRGQGWHFGKPLTLEDTRQLLVERDLLTGANTDAMAGDVRELRRG